MRTNTDAVNIYRLQKAIQTVELEPNHSADAIRDYYRLGESTAESQMMQQFFEGKFIFSIEQLEQCIKDAIEESFKGADKKLERVAQNALDKVIQSL